MTESEKLIAISNIINDKVNIYIPSKDVYMGNNIIKITDRKSEKMQCLFSGDEPIILTIFKEKIKIDSSFIYQFSCEEDPEFLIVLEQDDIDEAIKNYLYEKYSLELCICVYFIMSKFKESKNLTIFKILINTEIEEDK